MYFEFVTVRTSMSMEKQRCYIRRTADGKEASELDEYRNSYYYSYVTSFSFNCTVLPRSRNPAFKTQPST